MDKLIEKFSELLLEDLGKSFAFSLFCSIATIFGLYYTNWPNIFNLTQSISGAVKFSFILFFLVILWSVVYKLVFYIFKDGSKRKNEIMQNLNMLSNNQNVYQNESYIIGLLIENRIHQFNMDTIRKLSIVHHVETESKINSYPFKCAMEKAISNLLKLKIIETTGYKFYKINEYAYDKLFK
ncbi:MAG: hypothetical protein IJ877_00400 [Candidatus Gastranaerophilales bacterium]|nr:hypothetical protein [Candidatus Gastranaerophilales bacterium]